MTMPHILTINNVAINDKIKLVNAMGMVLAIDEEILVYKINYCEKVKLSYSYCENDKQNF